MYLDYAEFQAKRQIPMTMEDWALRLNKFLDFNEVEILTDKGRVSAEIAKAFAESEFEKYRIVQDKLFKSDFDKFLSEAKAIEETHADNWEGKSVLKKYFGKVDLELFATAATDGMRYNVAYYTPS